MNISKKALMSFLMALTSLIAMAQPYYHIMKEVDGKLIEDTVYNGKNYNIKIDMNEPKPKDAIGDKITVPCSGRSFYFTKHGNVYYNNLEGKFYFEKNQFKFDMEFPKHIGYFYYGNDIKSCIDKNSGWSSKEKQMFYFANPDNLGKLQEDLGNERWGVLTDCEWDYVCKNFGEAGWIVGGFPYYFIDTTPDKSLLRTIESKNGGKTMSAADLESYLESYEDRGLVCLPPTGYMDYSDKYKHEVIYSIFYYGYYWTSTYQGYYYYYGRPKYADYMYFNSTGSGTSYGLLTTRNRLAVRLVVLAEDD